MATLRRELQVYFLSPLAYVVLTVFLLVNGSILVAWRHHLTGERAVLWQPTRR